MADDQDGALVIADHLLQQVERFQVEIVGRLVEDQQVGFARELAGEQQARALAARQRADLRLGQRRVEQELLQIAMDMLAGAPHVDPVAAVGQHFAHALFGAISLRCWSMMTPSSVLAWKTLPSSGWISPVSRRSRVVFPAPFEPTMPIRSPRVTFRLRS